MSSYSKILEDIFFDRYEEGVKEILFSRDDIITVANKLRLTVRNIGDVVYSFRYRSPSEKIKETASEGWDWAIKGVGDALYKFIQVRYSQIVPNENLCVIKIPDATPEIIAKYAQGDEQSLLAKLRYNRLIDTFLGVTAYSLQNHLRTKIPEIGQMEIDEVYVAVDKSGTQYVVPVEAKGGKDKSGVVQTEQDYQWCVQRLPGLVPRPVTAQFMADGVIALLELTVQDGQIRIKDEKHYKLVSFDELSANELNSYRSSSGL